MKKLPANENRKHEHDFVQELHLLQITDSNLLNQAWICMVFDLSQPLNLLLMNNTDSDIKDIVNYLDLHSVHELRDLISKNSLSPSIKNKVHKQVEEGKLNLLKIALDKTMSNECGKSTLYTAARFNQIEAIKYISEYTSDQSRKDDMLKVLEQDFSVEDHENLLSRVETGNMEIALVMLAKMANSSQGSDIFVKLGCKNERELKEIISSDGNTLTIDMIKKAVEIDQTLLIRLALIKSDCEGNDGLGRYFSLNNFQDLKDLICNTDLSSEIVDHIIEDVKIGHLTLLKLALNKEAKYESGKTLLYFASRLNQIEAVKYLATHCGRQDITDFINSRTYSENIIELKDQEQLRPEVESTIKSAAENGQVEIIYLILSQLFKSETGSDNNPKVFQMAESMGFKNMKTRIQKLKKKDQFTEIELLNLLVLQLSQNKPQSKYSPIHQAAKKGNKDLLCYLLNFVDNADIVDSEDQTPLHWAALKGHFEAVEMLLEKGADVNALTNSKYSQLHWAANGGHLEIVEKLLEKGADVNALDKYKQTPLHEATGYRHLKIVKKFLQKGADPTIKNIYGETPLDWANYKNLQEAVQLMDSYAMSL